MEQTTPKALPAEMHEPYEFKCLDPTEDRELLQSLAYDPAQVDEQWMQELDQCMAAGSVALNSSSDALSQRESVLRARREFAQKLGLYNPGHRLHAAYVAGTDKGANVPMPTRILGAFRGITEATGAPQSALEAVQEVPYLLRRDGNKIRTQYRYMERLAAKLGWQGDIQELVREEPDILVLSLKKVSVMGRIAARHASPNQRDMSNKAVANVLRRPLEVHLTAIINRGESYTFGQGVDQGVCRARERKEVFYTAIRERKAAARLGHDVLRGYFRHRRPDATAKREHPHILPFLGNRMYSENGESQASPPVITGEEPWLAEVPISKHPGRRKAWLTHINNAIAGGSISIAKRRSGGEKYEEVLGHRINFFKLLGWTRPNTEIGQAFISFSLQREFLVPPQRVVDILNLLHSRGITLTTSFLAASFYAYTRLPAAIEKRLDLMAEMGFDVPGLAAEKPSIVRISDSLAIPILERRAALLKSQNDDMLSKHGATTLPGRAE